MKVLSWVLQAIATSSVLLPSASASASASPNANANANDKYVAFESIRAPPRGWTRVRSALPDDPVRLRLSLRQQNLDRFYEGLLQVSTPGHPRYGRHYGGAELRALLRPSDEARAAAAGWLRGAGVPARAVRDDGDYLYVRTTAAAAGRLLATRFDWYRSAATGEELLRTTRYAVPARVAPHLNFVQPTTRFGGARPLASHVDVMGGGGAVSDGRSKWVSTAAAAAAAEAGEGGRVDAAAAGAAGAPAVNASCATAITPQCLMQLYNINFRGSAASNNKVGYASFVGESARFADMATFAKVYAPFAAKNANFSVVTFNGGVNDQASKNDSGEANLDQQYVAAVGFDVPVFEFVTGGLGQLVPDGDAPTQAENSNEPFLEFAMGLAALDDAQLPNSISISYGENEQEVPRAYAQQVCNLFAQLGARGKTVLVASGDSGVGDFCQANDGTNATRFQPQFPGSCPWVTTVGGTAGVAPETAVFFSSGGFSDVWPRPAYQDGAVAAYLARVGSNFTGLFNASGRATPDVATQSVGFQIIDQGRDGPVRGTSCAAPTFNGVVALLNTARLASGQPTMGFMNPWLYGNASAALNDVTTGASTGCDGLARFRGRPNGSPVVAGAGFAATAGWDAVTGLGTPDFGKMLAIAAPNVKNEGGVLTTA